MSLTATCLGLSQMDKCALLTKLLALSILKQEKTNLDITLTEGTAMIVTFMANAQMALSVHSMKFQES